MIGVIILAAAFLKAAVPTPEEFAERDQWVAAKFAGTEQQLPVEPGLVVYANYNPLQKNAHEGKPMKIKDVEFARGLHCHAYSKILVRLPSPGDTFTSVIGIDSNSMTSGGRGSVIFSVIVNGETAFRTDIVREGMTPIPVEVALKGATEFTLEISDAGDGIACDQSNWADAKVQLSDAKEVWLDEMNVVETQAKGYDRAPFISFTYGGQPSASLLSGWKLERTTTELDSFRTQYALTYTDPKTGLVVRCVGVAWKDYPTVEWAVYFKNEGSVDTPLLESLQAIDMSFERGTQGEFLLHHHVGDKCTIDSFAPIQTTLAPNTAKKFVPDGGRPSNGVWPYFNLERPAEKRGMIIAVGWPGQWAGRFERDGGNAVRVVAGQELTHLILHPGEEIRTPLIVLQFYAGDWLHAQNVWRRWMFDHNFPKDHGKPLDLKMGMATIQHYNARNTQVGDIEFLDRCREEKIPLTTWWMDAGWYVNDEKGWPQVGTWEVDRQRFPGGLKAISDHCHSMEIELLVWFEVERVSAHSWLTENHPEWVHGGAQGGLFKMDEPDAVKWITDHVDKILSDEGIDIYRSDFNIDPLSFWRSNDTEDRQGITEIRYVEGYLSYWDELQRRHPGMLIDACASGGRRDDLESMRRAVPLLRTDFEQSPEGNQCATYGFDLWLPYHDGVNWENVLYNFRSNMAPFLQLNWDVRKKDFNYDQGRKLLGQWRTVAPYFFGDFYPLSEYSTADTVWMAWQFDRADLEGGVVQAFRRSNCPYVSAQYKLRALTPDAVYVVSNLDGGETRMTGKDLMDAGLLVTIPAQRDAVLFTYKKAER